jgi:membrane protein implicated in regulation of membrane protease activity
MSGEATLVWFLVGLVLALLEFVVPGVLLIFFAFGAWVASLTTYLGWTETIPLQLLVFCGASVVPLVTLRDWMHGQPYGRAPDPAQALDEFKGKRVTLLKDVAPGRSEAAVELKGAVWAVEADQAFRAGEVALVTGVEGIALKITPTPEGGHG